MSIAERYKTLLSAAGFAARAHQGQKRKDGVTPYVAHPFRVCLIVRHVFGIDDPTTLTTALLHDTIEDTTTDWDDLSETYGPEVATAVGALSKDSRLETEEREKHYKATLGRGSEAVVLCKLGDIFDNTLDSESQSATARKKTMEKSLGYLEALRPALTEKSRPAWEIVKKLVDEVAVS